MSEFTSRGEPTAKSVTLDCLQLHLEVSALVAGEPASPPTELVGYQATEPARLLAAEPASEPAAEPTAESTAEPAATRENKVAQKYGLWGVFGLVLKFSFE